jgi:hypothetical protein
MNIEKKYKDLNQTFNVDSEIVVSEKESKISELKVDSTQDDINKDYEYTRGNLYAIIEKGQEALNGILELAQESDMPRAYEVAGQLIKSVSDATDKLMDLQKKIRDIDQNKYQGPTTVNNALYVGSTAELLKLIKQQKEDK